MIFSDSEIDIARQLHAAGLAWTPACGHYVLDTAGIIEKPSPFQSGVYFILNYDYFITLVGGVDSFRQKMIWLPTWEQCREILNELGVDATVIAQTLTQNDALASGSERESLYRLILDRVSGL